MSYKLDDEYKNHEARQQKQEQEKIEKQLAFEHQKQEEQQQHINRQLIENEYYKLSNSTQAMYTNFVDSILKKHQAQLVNIFGDKAAEELIFCVYAVANNNSYNPHIELYLQRSLHINLRLN